MPLTISIGHFFDPLSARAHRTLAAHSRSETLACWVLRACTVWRERTQPVVAIDRGRHAGKVVQVHIRPDRVDKGQEVGDAHAELPTQSPAPGGRGRGERCGYGVS